MEPTITFHIPNGDALAFEKRHVQERWDLEVGVVLFAASDAFGYRIIRAMEVIGRPHDVRLILALTEAERYGANQVLVAHEMDSERRKEMIDGLEMALNPIIRRIGDEMAEPQASIAA